MRAVYPWSAVVGQSALKHALLLCAIDPAIGGVLLSGPRGVAKTTIARALGELTEGRFVELPLGASEERVTGTLDLGAALRDGEVTFSPGLLSRAHQGVLYVDEVNLLPDGLVDLLLDAAASGHNQVERDGLSHSHDARFVLIGTMNPDEGELRPQLTDRFGLSVHAEAEISPRERAEIVGLRLEFDRDPAAFVARFAEAQRALIERCRRARTLAQTIPLAGSALELVSERCHAARVEGVRADLAMIRAARAHAAWNERPSITPDDVEAVAELALNHRRHEPAEPPKSPPSGSGGSSGGRPSGGASSSSPAPSTRQAAPREQAGDRADSASSSTDRGALAAVPMRAAPPIELPARLLDGGPAGRLEARRRGRARLLGPRGRRTRTSSRAGSIDWFATLVRSRRPRLEDVRYRVRRAPKLALWVVALDCSASMLRSGALSAAKSVAHALEKSARQAGAHLALIAFQGPSARLEAGPKAASSARTRAVDALGGGGGTPLREALQTARDVCRSARFQAAAIQKRIVLLTDGRTRERFDDLADLRDDASLLVIDCERGPVRLGRAPVLAVALGARSLHVDSLG
jgi:magnesium chelatase subunit D